MKVVYDPEVDVLRILFSNAPIEESDEDKPGVILSEFDQFGAVFERGETAGPEREINLALFRKYRGLCDGKFKSD